MKQAKAEGWKSTLAQSLLLAKWIGSKHNWISSSTMPPSSICPEALSSSQNSSPFPLLHRAFDYSHSLYLLLLIILHIWSLAQGQLLSIQFPSRFRMPIGNCSISYHPTQRERYEVIYSLIKFHCLSYQERSDVNKRRSWLNAHKTCDIGLSWIDCERMG